MKIALNLANQCLDHSLGGRVEGAGGGAGTVNTSSMKTPLMVITKLGNCLKCNLLQKISSFCVLEFLDSEHMY